LGRLRLTNSSRSLKPLGALAASDSFPVAVSRPVTHTYTAPRYSESQGWSLPLAFPPDFG